MKKEVEEVRIDKYLWAIRLFKTRTMATNACNAGKVKVKEQSVKPSYKVKVGDLMTVRVNYQLRTIEVVSLIEKRVGAKIAVDCYKDLTPDSDKAEAMKAAFYSAERRDRGAGRPTKKERRDILDFKDEEDFDDWEEW